MMTMSGGVTVVSTMAFGAVMIAQEQLAPAGSTMDPTLFAAAIVTVIAALGGVTVQVINSVSAARDRREAAAERKVLMERTNATASKADTIMVTSAEIKELTNSTNSNLQKALELMTEKYAGSQRALSQAQETKREVAAAQAVTDLTRAIHTTPPDAKTAMPSDSVIHEEATSILESIDANTDAIKSNTAKTDATVTALKKDAL